MNIAILSHDSWNDCFQNLIQNHHLSWLVKKNQYYRSRTTQVTVPDIHLSLKAIHLLHFYLIHLGYLSTQIHFQILKISIIRAGEMAQRERIHVALAEDWGSILSTYNHL